MLSRTQQRRSQTRRTDEIALKGGVDLEALLLPNPLQLIDDCNRRGFRVLGLHEVDGALVKMGPTRPEGLGQLQANDSIGEPGIVAIKRDETVLLGDLPRASGDDWIVVGLYTLESVKQHDAKGKNPTLTILVNLLV